MDIIQQLGGLSLASRLRRLSEWLMSDVSKIYDEQKVDFQARWFPVIYLLSMKSPQAVTDAARQLKLSHPAINQISNQMAKAGLLESYQDEDDKRKRLLQLSKEGKKTVEKLKPLWEIIRLCNEELLQKAPDFTASLDMIEKSLAEKSMYDRVKTDYKNYLFNQVQIVDYKTSYKKYFKEYNEEWLKKYFSVEPTDKIILEDPQQYVIKKGGQVFFARIDDHIIGTVAMVRHGEKNYELAKMAVTESARGLQAGRKLAAHAINWALKQKAETIFLETSMVLEASVELYAKLGFELYHNPRHIFRHQRESILMKLNLENYPYR